ncbi:PepSY domain-containing protein [Solirhodobacter olei]|uniref:PepSY domain-containing protein n=1 Tax=Solirhodobacter olei TaxID=2493082 RepID=UPI000FDA089B|nr:PepSY domain-containing protein [Solirhodobacter olei]
MLRSLHQLPGLLAAVLIAAIAISGAMLSVVPAYDSLTAPAAPAAQMSVATLAANVAQAVPGVSQLTRNPSGSIIADYSNNSGMGSDRIDPNTGKVLGPYNPSPVYRWLYAFHRSLLMGTAGRLASALTALALITLCISGAVLLARRMGGWQRILGRARGSVFQRLHITLARFALVGLLFSAMTGIYISLTNFDLIPNGLAQTAPFPNNVPAGHPMPITAMPALRGIKVSQLRTLTYPTDPSDVFTVSTGTGQGYVDQAQGQMLNWTPDDAARRIYEAIYMLHTGEGFWSLGLLLGLAALCAPFLSITGALVWWRRRRSRPRFRHNHTSHSADTIILVGSEGNATWGFARTLHDALTEQGYRCHTGSMNTLARRYPHAERMFIMTSTHGNGDAPSSARSFLSRLERMRHSPGVPVALLGFGDRQFPQFAKFGHDVAEALDARRWHAMLPYEAIDRQSPQEFARWGRAVGEALGHGLELNHQPVRPASTALQLVERIDYGHEVQAPTAILRFAVPEVPATLLQRLSGRAGLPRASAGDLLGILPPDSVVPRFYSLASSSRDGFLEICVRKHPGGECSGFLHSLMPGEMVEAFVKPNPDFRPARGRRPVIMIGAGTGIGPLAGFIRNNARGRAIHLYFGGRDPRSDFLYAPELDRWLGERRLTSLTTAFSRIQDRAYVQDRIMEDAHHLSRMIQKGAQIMVCGGAEMAAGVMEALDAALAPMGLSAVALKAEGRYVEDVY